MLPENKLKHDRRWMPVLDGGVKLGEPECLDDCPACAVDNYIKELKAYLDSDELREEIADFLYKRYIRPDYEDAQEATIKVISLIGG